MAGLQELWARFSAVLHETDYLLEKEDGTVEVYKGGRMVRTERLSQGADEGQTVQAVAPDGTILARIIVKGGVPVSRTFLYNGRVEPISSTLVQAFLQSALQKEKIQMEVRELDGRGRLISLVRGSFNISVADYDAEGKEIPGARDNINVRQQNIRKLLEF